MKQEEEIIDTQDINPLNKLANLVDIYQKACIGCMIVVVILGSFIYMQHVEYNNTVEEYQEKIFAAELEYRDLNDLYKEDEEEIKELKTDIVELGTIAKDLDFSREELLNVNQELNEELEFYYEREELFNKYEYAIFDGNRRTDITYEQLASLEEMLKDSKIQDPDLILSWIMVESKGTEKAVNSSSSAKGYGQFLDGTSRYTYTVLLNQDNWSPSVALDGETNMKMMVAYLDYLYDYHDNLYDVMNSYTGGLTPAYESKLNSYLAIKGKSVNSIANYLYEYNK